MAVPKRQRSKRRIKIRKFKCYSRKTVSVIKTDDKKAYRRPHFKEEYVEA